MTRGAFDRVELETAQVDAVTRQHLTVVVGQSEFWTTPHAYAS